MTDAELKAVEAQYIMATAQVDSLDKRLHQAYKAVVDPMLAAGDVQGALKYIASRPDSLGKVFILDAIRQKRLELEKGA